MELNATQLLLETITGRSTTLFRPPYNADTSPSSLSDLVPLRIANDLNYLVVLENIDPEDWARPGVDVILQRIKQQRRDGSIILLHDAGGDRSQTIAALPQIIDWLVTRGDTIVPLSTLMGTTRDAIMPPVGSAQRLPRFVSSPRLSRGRGISLGLHAGRDRVDRAPDAEPYPARGLLSPAGSGQRGFLATAERPHRRLQRGEGDWRDPARGAGE